MNKHQTLIDSLLKNKTIQVYKEKIYQATMVLDQHSLLYDFYLNPLNDNYYIIKLI